MLADTRVETLEHSQHERSRSFFSSDSSHGYGLFLGHEHDLNSNDESFSESSGYFESLLDTCVCQSVFTHSAGGTQEPHCQNKKVYSKKRKSLSHIECPLKNRPEVFQCLRQLEVNPWCS